MSSCQVTVKLSRFERQPWGFRLHGGTDFGTPLLIQKVNISSLSESAGLQAGDILLQVNGVNVEQCRHKEAQDKIVSAGNNFTLTVQRGGVLSQALKPQQSAPQQQQPPAGINQPPQPPKEWRSALESDTAAAATNAEDFTKSFMAQLRGDVPANIPAPAHHNGNTSVSYSAPVDNGEVTVVSRGGQLSQNSVKTTTPTAKPMAVHKQYNSPQPLYSEDSIQEVLSQQAEVLSNGVKGIDFNQYRRSEPKVLHNSEVLKLLREQEAGLCPAFGSGSTGSGGQQQRPASGGFLDQQHRPSNRANARSCPSPANTFPRRGESPAMNRQNIVASPSLARNNQVGNSGSSSQGRGNMEDSSVTNSFRTKKDQPGIRDHVTPSDMTDGPSVPAVSELDKKRGINQSLAKFTRSQRNKDDPSLPPKCEACHQNIDRGPFITALGKTWCPNHFLCNMEKCGKSLQEVGFVEEKGLLYCEDCYGRYLAPDCEKCRKKIIGNCLKAMGKTFHPECFTCAYCNKLFNNSPFYLEDGLPYCEEDWNELFTTKCVSCGFPIEAGDRWVEALNNNYHSQCFNCTLCKKNLEGQSFFVKAGKPFCKAHARG